MNIVNIPPDTRFILWATNPPTHTVIYYYYGSWTAYDVVTIANNVGGEYGGWLLTLILFVDQCDSTNASGFFQLFILKKEAALASLSHSSFPTTPVTTVAEAIGNIVA